MRQTHQEQQQQQQQQHSEPASDASGDLRRAGGPARGPGDHTARYEDGATFDEPLVVPDEVAAPKSPPPEPIDLAELRPVGVGNFFDPSWSRAYGLSDGGGVSHRTMESVSTRQGFESSAFDDSSVGGSLMRPTRRGRRVAHVSREHLRSRRVWCGT